MISAEATPRRRCRRMQNSEVRIQNEGGGTFLRILNSEF
jgi:hypothetical protein